MLKEHKEQMKLYERIPHGKLMFAMAILTDVVDGKMKGEELRIHVNDAKEMIGDSIIDVAVFDDDAKWALEHLYLLTPEGDLMPDKTRMLDVARKALELRNVVVVGRRHEVVMLPGGYVDALQKLENAPVSAWSGEQLDALEVAKSVLKEKVA